MVRPRPSMPTRSTGARSSASFHAGSPIPTSLFESRRSSVGYHTFPAPGLSTPREGAGPESGEHAASPLPVKQLALLALLSFAEQTALNSISPYVPSMIQGFPDVAEDKVGLYVGILASAFALAQLSTNFFWGYLSDRIGRKPVLILGAVLLAGCFLLFGFCTVFWQALLVHIAMGLLNGNAAVVPSALGDLTDKSNQSAVFTWLPIIYSVGGLSGPALGGLLVGTMGDKYPFAVSNVVVAVILALSSVVVAIWFEETHEDHGQLSKDIDTARKRLGIFPRSSITHPLLNPRQWLNGDINTDGAADETPASPAEEPQEDEGSGSSLQAALINPWREILNRSTMFLLATYLIYQLSNISFNSLYPIFAAAPAPTGRALEPATIGLSLSVSGAFTIVFQAFMFRPLKARLGNLRLYRVARLGLAVSTAAMPLVGYRDDEPLFGVGTGAGWLYLELLGVLILKNVSAVGGLSCVMLLVSSPLILFFFTPCFAEGVACPPGLKLTWADHKLR